MLSPKPGHDILLQKELAAGFVQTQRGIADTEKRADMALNSQPCTKQGLPGCSSPGAAAIPGSSSKHAGDVLQNLEMAEMGRQRNHPSAASQQRDSLPSSGSVADWQQQGRQGIAAQFLALN